MKLKKLAAIAISASLALVGCSSEQEIPQVTSATQDGQEAQANPEGTQTPEAAQITYDLFEETVDDSMCKLIEDSSQRRDFYDAYAVSFPANPTLIEPVGTVNVSVIPVDWEDAAGDLEPSAYISDQLNTLTTFYSVVSDRNLSINIDLHDKWVRLDGASADYYITEEEESDFRAPAVKKRTKLFSAAVTESDPEVDFSNADIVLLILPAHADVIEVGALSFATARQSAIRLTADGNTMVNLIAGGNRWDKRPQTNLWSFWAHEMSHMLGLPDMVLHGNIQGLEMWQNNPFSGYDIMAQQDGPLRTINSWTRWVNGWISDDSVLCAPVGDMDSSVFAIAPLNESGAAEARSIVIKLSDDEVLVIENRTRDSRFDTPVGGEWYGVVSYVVSRKLGHGEAPMKLVTHLDGEKNMQYLDDATNLNTRLLYGTLTEGDSSEYYDLRIEALRIEDGLAFVQVSSSEG